MDTPPKNHTVTWPLWRTIIFRFFFVYLLLIIEPWSWLDEIYGVSYVTQYYHMLMDWAVNTSNALVFHVRPVLVPTNGSGDTSYGWALVWLFICVAVAACIIWSAFDRKRKNYEQLNYWLCLFARYFIAYIAFIYGIEKLFAMQMYFPSLHQLATPLGDLLPMRLSWLFIGYSTPYQVFSGAMEVLAGLLLLNRRTATLGIIIATGVFTNVMMLNLSYDIPVKIFSMQMVLVCLFLLANESRRIWYFFVLNKPAPISNLYQFNYQQKWMRVTRIVLKVVFIIIAIAMQFYNDWGYFRQSHSTAAKQPVKNGVYEVTSFTVNRKAIPLSLSDTLRWQDVIFENGLGSIKTADTSFGQRYKRGYFVYIADKKLPVLHFKKQQSDSLAFADFCYTQPDANTIQLSGKLHNDSLFVVLRRTNRHFQLAEKQFHWLSEHNR